MTYKYWKGKWTRLVQKAKKYLKSAGVPDVNKLLKIFTLTTNECVYEYGEYGEFDGDQDSAAGSNFGK